MQLNLCPLFSGSSGNSVYVACGGVRLLVDAGVSATRVEANLREIGVDIREIDAILVTHEHVDHVRGLGVLCRRFDVQRPLQLPKHNREWEKFGRTFYTQEHFTESIGFDKLEVELLTPDGEKKHSGPRTPLMDA